jgi:hypothetical protein
MFFLFGSGKSTLPNKFLLSGCECPNCHQKETLYTETKARYFHFFFIPVFPLMKTTVAVCSYCKAVYNENQFSENMRDSYQRQNDLNPNKRPIWHGCGCFIIILFILFTLIVSVIGYFKNPSEKSSEKEDPRRAMLKDDLKKTTSSPTASSDSTAFQLRNCMNEMLIEEIHPEKFEWYTAVNEDKLLILVKVDNMKKIKTSERGKLVGYIHDCLGFSDGYQDKKIYVGVEGRWNMVLSASPHRTDFGGSFADEKLLYDFYDKTKEIDTIVIQKKTK